MPEIHRLRLPTPFPVGPVNAYVIKGSPLTLVDTGPAYDPGRDALTGGLRRLGLTLKDIELVLLTHPHIDHYGLAGEVAAVSGAVVAAHVEAAPRLGAAPHSAQEGEREALESVLVRSGAPAGFGDKLYRLWTMAGMLAAPVEVDRAIEDGDTLEGGGVTWRAVHSPGHSPGSLCFLDEVGGRLFSGDHLLPHITSNAIVEFRAVPGSGGNGPVLLRERNLEIYIDSLRRTSDLEAGEVHPGHGPTFRDHKALIADRMRHYDGRKVQIRKLLRDRGPSTVFDLALILFPEQRDATGQFLALSEVLGHLDLLETDGAVLRREDRARDLYVAVK